jgi:glycosyltransferase involved in cell wall biosynthesis
VGSLTADKRYEFLFDVMKRMGPGAPQLVVCGQGPLAAKLQQHVAELGLNVVFAGMLSPAALIGAYSAATCMVHACEIETFGLSVLEAMACGRPVVAVDGGGVPEVLGDTGVLTQSNDAAGFAGQLRALFEDPDRQLRLGAAARLRATQHFSLVAMRQAYADAVESVCSAGQPLRTIENVDPAPSRL